MSAFFPDSTSEHVDIEQAAHLLLIRKPDEPYKYRVVAKSWRGIWHNDYMGSQLDDAKQWAVNLITGTTSIDIVAVVDRELQVWFTLTRQQLVEHLRQMAHHLENREYLD